MTTAMHDGLSMLGQLLVVFDERRLAICPHCECTTVWRNPEEFQGHALSCGLIAIGLRAA